MLDEREQMFDTSLVSGAGWESQLDTVVLNFRSVRMGICNLFVDVTQIIKIIDVAANKLVTVSV